ncbi:MAG: lipoate--protein ligase family protein [Nitrospinae bacterium]|nr:lipoate--protein ligase family protein [Nitrospinota bacterium]
MERKDSELQEIPHARFLNTGESTAAWNMAVDELLFESCQAHLREGRPPGEAPFTFRVYAWSPPAISLGRGQAAGRDIFLERLADEGIEICRRLTGGRAVLHDCELTYSITGPQALLGDAIEETYHRISRGLAEGLAALGAQVELAPPSGSAYASQGSCFATASVWELAIGGKKVVGSAQCREGGAVLQHGSVLFRSSEERLAGLLKPRKGVERMPSRQVHAIGLWEVLGKEIQFDDVADALRAGLEKVLGFRFSPGTLSDIEIVRVLEISDARYENREWTLAR